MFEHRGVEIKVTETTSYKRNGTSITSQHGGMFYVAESVYGLAIDGWQPQRALEGAKRQIDEALDK